MDLNGLSNWLTKNPHLVDALSNGSCVAVQQHNDGTFRFKQVPCGEGKRGQAVTITEPAMGKFHVSPGHISKFSGDGLAAKHVTVMDQAPAPPAKVHGASSAGKELVRKAQERMRRLSQPGWTEAKEQDFVECTEFMDNVMKQERPAGVDKP